MPDEAIQQGLDQITTAQAFAPARRNPVDSIAQPGDAAGDASRGIGIVAKADGAPAQPAQNYLP
jgi:hypothetical protein